MRPAHRSARALLVTAALAALLTSSLAACTGSGAGGTAATRTATTRAASSSAAATSAPTTALPSAEGSSGTSPSPGTRAPDRTVTRALLPIVHGGSHPGAAVLGGDVRSVPDDAFLPTLARAPDDGSGFGSCQVDQDVSTPRYCTYGDTTDPTHTVVVVGDSLAGQWLKALREIAAPHHWRIIIALHSRCPWTAAMTVNTGTTTPYTSCHTWGATVARQLLGLRPDVVLTTDLPTLGTPDHAPGAAAATEVGQGMATYWRRLIAAGIEVAPIRETPVLPRDVPTCLASAAPGACGAPRASAVPPTTPVTVAARIVGAAAHLIDLTNLVCGPQTCAPIVGNVLIYRDMHHITATYTLTIAPYLERLLITVPALARS